MKKLILIFAVASVSFTCLAKNSMTLRDSNYVKKAQPDSVKIKIEGSNAYYQNVVKLDSIIKEPLIYIRALQFAAAKNLQQNYGYEEEGKLIFTTTQDLNVEAVSPGDDGDDVDPYTVQFAVTLDIKSGTYRYTIHNITFYLPGPNGNRRETLFDIYAKSTNTNSRRISKGARRLMDSFERYLNSLTSELYEAVEHKQLIYNSKF